MSDFNHIKQNYFDLLISLVVDAHRICQDTLSNDSLVIDEKVHAVCFYSTLHKLVFDRRDYLRKQGIELLESNSSAVKFFLCIPQYNCLIRFGKMTSNYHMVKISSNIDREFARQQRSFGNYENGINLHLGYIVNKKRNFKLEDIILAEPISPFWNREFALMSKNNENTLLISNNSSMNAAPGTLLSNLESAMCLNDDIKVKN